MPEMSPEDAATFSKRGSDVFRKLERLPIPVMAAVNGFALGGGCELMLACDFAYAAENARFGQPEVNLGIIAGFGGTQRLMRKIPYGMAIELLMNAEMIKADEALRIGLTEMVVPDAAFDDAILKLAKQITENSAFSHAANKRLLEATDARDMDSGLQWEVLNNEGVGPDMQARIAAFTGKSQKAKT